MQRRALRARQPSGKIVGHASRCRIPGLRRTGIPVESLFLGFIDKTPFALLAHPETTDEYRSVLVRDCCVWLRIANLGSAKPNHRGIVYRDDRAARELSVRLEG
jgi:hypothetical protein